MIEHNFTLVIRGDLTDEQIELLYGAGCDDGLIGSIDGQGQIEFDRLARSFASAVLSAVNDVESVPGLEVERVVPDELVTMAEIAERLGRSHESVRLLAKGQRQAGSGFPEPVVRRDARSPLWRWHDVAGWAGSEKERADAAVIDAVNASLQLRAAKSSLAPGQQKKLLDIAAA
jgi:hypothetical protein